MNVKSLTKLISLNIAALILAACASSSPTISTVHSLNFKSETDKALLFLYRPSEFMNGGVSSSFRINDQKVGIFKSGFFRIPLEPGAYELKSFFPSGWEDAYYMGQKVDSPPSSLLIPARRGEVIYVEFSQGNLRPVLPSEAKSEILELSYYQSAFNNQPATLPKVVSTDSASMNTEALRKTCQNLGNAELCDQLAEQESGVMTLAPTPARMANQTLPAPVPPPKSKQETQFDRDSALPIEVRRDKYMMALTNKLKTEQYEDALKYFDWLNRLNVELSPSFTFFHGEALLKSGKPEQALEQLYLYLKNAGPSGKHYNRALELVNEAELKL